MNKSTIVAGAMTLAALGVGGTLTSQALAETTSPTPSPSASSTASSTSAQQDQTQKQQGRSQQGENGEGREGRGHGGPGGRGERGMGMVGHSEELAEKLGLDAETVRTAMQEVAEANRPTREQGQRPTDAEREAHRTVMIKALASKLGVTEAKLTEAMDAIQAERNAEQATQLKSRLDQAVKDGKLTQAEADAVTKAVKAGVIGGGHGR